MPRPRKPARLYCRPHDTAWVIRDGGKDTWTGVYGEGNRQPAEAALAAYLASRDSRPGPSQPNQITVGAVLTLYLTEHGPSVADPQRLAWAAKALAPFWGNLTCDAAKGSTARAYAKKRGVASATVRREIGVLNAAFNYAHAEGVLIHPIRLPLPDHGAARERFLSRDELRRLLRASPAHLRTFLIVGVLTGTRPGTILRTCWTPSLSAPWVDLDRGVYHRAGATERQTKKRRGDCRLPAPLWRYLRRVFQSGATHLVTWRGKPVRDIGKALDAACKESGVERITPHVVKHTAVTWAFDRGMSLEDAAEFFATTSTTLERVYRQHSPHHQSRAAEIMGRRA